MPGGEAVLVAAQSGRALAEAARRAGFRPYVADLFGDEDTLALADGYRALPGRFGTGRLGGRAVLDALDALHQEAGSRTLGVILGSGFEGAPDLMGAITERHRLIGATPETVALLKDPFRFADLCARLDVPHPAVSAGPASEGRDWLLKRAGGSGGSHIRAAPKGRLPEGCYLQERVPGRAFALNLLADGRDAQVLAITEQWSAPSRLRPFRYAGALMRGRDEPEVLPEAVRNAATEAVARIVEETGLRGIASADILAHEDGRWWLMEINPRPGATLDVLDRRPEPLLAAHVAASLGRIGPLGPAPVDAAGAEIWYGAREHRIGAAVDWPDHVRDRPRAKSLMRRDAPVCTILATGSDAAAVRENLRERAARVRALLEGENQNEHGPEERRDVSERERAHDAPGGAPRR